MASSLTDHTWYCCNGRDINNVTNTHKWSHTGINDHTFLMLYFLFGLSGFHRLKHFLFNIIRSFSINTNCLLMWSEDKCTIPLQGFYFMPFISLDVNHQLLASPHKHFHLCAHTAMWHISSLCCVPGQYWQMLAPSLWPLTSHLFLFLVWMSFWCCCTEGSCIFIGVWNVQVCQDERMSKACAPWWWNGIRSAVTERY